MKRIIPLSALVFPIWMVGCAGSEDLGAERSLDPNSLDCEATARCSDTDTASEETITLSGKVYVFQTRDFLPYATITIEEEPGFYAVTDANGDWSISGLPAGEELTPKVTFPNGVYTSLGIPAFQDMHQQTFRSDEDIEMLYFQAVPQYVVAGLAAMVGVSIDSSACQVVTTITDPAMEDVTTWEDFDAFIPHGIAGMTAELKVKGNGTDIDVPDPVYFNSSVLPDLSLTESSIDGGVLWANVEAGETYRIKTKDPSGAYDFDKISVDCQAGRFINASPPWGPTAY